MLLRQSLVVGSVSAPEDLAGDDDALSAPAQAFDRVPHYRLSITMSVGLGIIEEIHASIVSIPLIRPDGGSEPELSIGTDGTTVFVSISWTQFATNAWKASFGHTPVFQGQIDASLAPGVGGGEDADVDLGSTGTLHAT